VNALDPATIGQLQATLRAVDLVGILQAFEADLGRLAADYEASAATDGDQARRAAHALAGTAAGIGAKRLEAAARRAMPAGAPDLSAEIRQETDAALAEIAALAARLAAG
jgi:HPt (histidine-containing phosphotransfer) domain-containing protein